MATRFAPRQSDYPMMIARNESVLRTDTGFGLAEAATKFSPADGGRTIHRQHPH